MVSHSGSNAAFLQVAEVIAYKNARLNMIRGDQPGRPPIVYSQETSVFLVTLKCGLTTSALAIPTVTRWCTFPT